MSNDELLNFCQAYQGCRCRITVYDGREYSGELVSYSTSQPLLGDVVDIIIWDDNRPYEFSQSEINKIEKL